MKIMYILNARWPTIKAHGVQVAQTCHALSSAGARVTLVVPHRLVNAVHEGKDWKTVYGIPGNFAVQYLWSLDWVATGIIGKVLFVIQQTLFACRAWMYLLFRPGIIYSRDPFTLALCSVLPRRLFFEMHNWPSHNLLYWLVLRRMSGIVVITRAIKERLVGSGYPAVDRILVAPDGVDLKAFADLPEQSQIRRNLHLTESVPIVLYAGHLYGWKGVDTLAEAASAIEGVVVFVGGSEVDVARMKDRYGQVPNILFVGHRPHVEIPLWLKAADVLVLPNRKDAGISEFYTSPLKMFEYMASGTPIVASDLPSIREVLNDTNAILVRPDDSRALGEGISQAIGETDARAKKARSDVEQYSWFRRGEKIIEFIDSRHLQ